MNINDYLKEVNKKYSSGISTEHSYRGDLEHLIKNIVKNIVITNEPKRQKCGAPDYIIQNKEVPLGYIEAKDIGIDLNKAEKSSQMQRYLESLDNIILTDYIEFRFYKYRTKVKEIKIASIDDGRFKSLPENFDSFTTHINDFCEFKGQTIKSAEKLARMMAQKARMMEEVLFNAVNEDDEDNTLKDQLKSFRQVLIHDLNEKTFADIYAQTIAYGLFAARLHDTTLRDFSRQEARDLIPKSNPFLRNLFDYVSGAQLDDRVVWIVDDLADIFRATDLQSILADFGKLSGQNDPFLHFYETFLAEYDPKLRKSRGVYYTPEPVVNFIVRAVDDILKEEFGLSQGLADTSKVIINLDSDIPDKRSKTGYKQIEKEVHKVQILDPATGTGTFLTETIKQIYKRFKGQEGLWSSYIEDHLIPRLNGFEILMASYTMCHLKLEMLLRETGYKPTDEKNQKRLRVFLTNSLEEAHADTGTLFASWLSREAIEANYIKRDTPVMVIIGNPPYANFGQMNQGEWIKDLIAVYKKDLNEKKINLDDDYIKFIRYGQYFIEKNGEGILAYISNNSFIDGITHRQMRKHLLETFDKIYILDLHGSAKKNEVTLDGTKDENVFDIQQGVSISLFVKKNLHKKMGEVLHSDIYGTREDKYESLLRHNIRTISWNKLNYKDPYYFFVPKDFSLNDSYQEYISINDLFSEVNNGIKTDRDSLFIDFNKHILTERMKILLSGNMPLSFAEEYRVIDSSSYKITQKIQSSKYDSKYLSPIQYRPFDYRFTYYDPKIISRPAKKVMQSVLKGSIALLSCRQQSTFDFQHVLITNILSEVCTVSLQTKETSYVFPLYLYPESIEQKTLTDKNARNPNLNPYIVDKISLKLGLAFTPEKEETEGTFAPIDILDYIYSVLHSPNYREKYKEFLKIDFPRIPYPENKDLFWQLVKLGGELRSIHLLENTIVENYITTYPVSGNNVVDKPQYNNGKILINKEQYFDNVPEIAWYFYIGGYQPAQKWLKDRKGRELSVEDILHYQKIIVALSETDRIMKEIDEIIEL